MTRESLKRLVDIPNVGKTMERDFILLGIEHPVDLIGRDPYRLYEELCSVTQMKHAPCVLDIFISAVRYMEGGPPKKWWEFTDERKRKFGGRLESIADIVSAINGLKYFSYLSAM